MMHIRFLERKDIDSERWDNVIAGSPAETIYAYSWYLDQVAQNWSALVVDKSNYVLPLDREYNHLYASFKTNCKSNIRKSLDLSDLVDAFVRDHASRGRILDFEGSNIPSVARFFIGFGARAEIYQGVNFNRLSSMLTKTH